MIDQTDSIVLGGGCFWCLDALYRRLKGVLKVETGYAGGTAENPTYMSVYSGTTGHAEVVRVTFDPKIIQLKTLIDIFWAIHDPTTLNKQGADVGTDYRSIILYNSADQKRIIADSMLYTATKLWSAPLTTEVKPLDKFYIAEPEHQNYAEANPASGYCRVVINPKLAKFKKQFVNLLA